MRLIIIVGALLVVVALAFGGYYYYDRYYSSKPTAMELTIKKAEQALVQDPKSADKRMDLAELYLVNSRYPDAIEYASQVLLTDAQNQRAWLVLGLGYAMKGEPAPSIEPLEKYYAANKDSEMPGLEQNSPNGGVLPGRQLLQVGPGRKSGRTA